MLRQGSPCPGEQAEFRAGDSPARQSSTSLSLTPLPGSLPPRGARTRWRLALTGQFVFVFAAVALTGPGRIDIVDGQTRYEVSRSLIEHGDSVIRDQHVRFRVHKGRDGADYTAYRFPQSGLGAVAILASDASGPVAEERRQFFFTLTSALAAALLAVTYSVWFRGLGSGTGASLAWATAGIFCTPCWFYSTSTFDDMLGTSAVVLAVVVAFLWRERRPLLGAAVAGVLMAWAINCKEPLALFVLPVLAACYRRGVPLRRQLAPVMLVLCGAALGVLAYKAYDWYKFPPGTTDPNAEYEKLYTKMWTADPLPGVAGFLFSPSAGILWYCPPFLLGLVGFSVWRRTQRGFCQAVALASLLFTLFLCFLTFFKGEPCWGPRYLTAVFALWWLFVPAALARVRPRLMALLLGLGAVVQLLALSVDPQRLLLDKVIPFTYYESDPWLQFHPEASHLWQRPREILDILSSTERPPEYSPAPRATHATELPTKFPVVLTSMVGLGANPMAPRGHAITFSWMLGSVAHTRVQYKEAVHRYQVFASFRPWWSSQAYLPPEARPVDIPQTLLLLLGMGVFGLGLMAVGSLLCTGGRRLPAAGKPADEQAIRA